MHPISANPDDILQPIRQEFEDLLSSVLHAQPDAYQFECALFRRLLAMGALLMRLFLCVQAQRYCPDTATDKNERELPFHSHKARSLVTVFGKVRFTRAYYYQQGAGGSGYYLMDAALNLPKSGVSDLLRQWREVFAVSKAYAKVDQDLQEILGLRVSSRALSQDIAADGALVHAFYAQAPPPALTEEASILVVQADGKGVPMVIEKPGEAHEVPAPPRKVSKGHKPGTKPGTKKEAIVTSVYRLAPAPRTPEVVADSFFKRKATQTGAPTQVPPLQMSRSAPEAKWLMATLNGKQAALSEAVHQAKRRDDASVRDRVALCDGCASLQTQIREQFPGYSLVLDFLHASDYSWKAADALYEATDPQRQEWAYQRCKELLSGKVKTVIASLRATAKERGPRGSRGLRRWQKQALRSVADYFEKNVAFMRYDEYLSRGWPIATGVIEGACRHVVKDRCELSGMRWRVAGANALLALRCVHENGDWQAFHAFRRSERQRELYGQAASAGVTALEMCACQAAQQTQVKLQLVA
jgi:Uncharacterised protein family (UPF0236)